MKSLWLVDDDPIFQYLFQLIFDKIKTNVKLNCINDGFDAKNSIIDTMKDKKSLPDAIVIDINMPRLNGWGFLKFLTEEVYSIKKLKTKIYVLSSSNSNLDQNQCKKYPFNINYLSKPIDQDTLSSIINQIED